MICGSFVQGVLLGFGAAVPIGPLNILIMSYALKDYGRGFCAGLGAMTTDIIYLTLLSFGILHLLNTPLILKFIAIFGAIFLSYIAYTLVKDASKSVEVNDDLKLESHLMIYVKGCLLNLTNPYIVLFWLSMATVMTSGQNSFFVTLFGLVISILIWITLFPLVIYKSRNKLSAKFTKALAYISALIMIFFALSLIYEHFIKGII